jgi:hypothetical protein
MSAAAATKTRKKPHDLLAAAASSAVHALAVAAEDARAQVANAAEQASQTLRISTEKAISEFPDIREDIREIRSSQALMVQSLTSVVTETLNQYTSAETARLGGIAKSVEEIKEHMKTQNGRLAKAESHIIRQNLVLFGIIGPTALAIGGYVVHAVILAGGILKLFGG